MRLPRPFPGFTFAILSTHRVQRRCWSLDDAIACDRIDTRSEPDPTRRPCYEKRAGNTAKRRSPRDGCRPYDQLGSRQTSEIQIDFDALPVPRDDSVEPRPLRFSEPLVTPELEFENDEPLVVDDDDESSRFTRRLFWT